jgi:rod shape-determining protein MreD
VNRSRARTWLFVGSIAFAFLLQLMPLPQLVLPLKPYWVGLVLIYWAIETPERVGLGFAFLVGLAGDLLSGDLLAEQALRLVVMIFIVLRFRARLRFFPMWQQALAVAALLLNDRIVVIMIRGFSGDPMPSPAFWLSPPVGMLLWPFVFLLLDDLRGRLRASDT